MAKGSPAHRLQRYTDFNAAENVSKCPMGPYRCLLLTLGGAPNNFSFLIRALLNQINDTSILYNVIMGILNVLRYLKFHGQVQTDLLHNGCKGTGSKCLPRSFGRNRRKKTILKIVVYSQR